MCLTSLLELTPEDKNDEWKVGYKVICDTACDLRGPFYSITHYKDGEHTKIGFNEEIVAHDRFTLFGFIDTRENESYRAGFHIFTRKKSAEDYLTIFVPDKCNIYKVLYKDVVARGLQDYDDMECVIARKMIIKPLVEAKGILA